MFIAHLHFTVAPESRDTVLEAFAGRADAVRAMKGCLAYRPFVDPADDTVIGVLHEWESEEDFAAYSSSEHFNALAAILRPMMQGKPVSRRFRAELVDVIN